ncbi:MAG TPA: MASE1 domain-containing protein [Steroidobacteraceae bacterium]|nr:MASE1 domain-containing protein [Steroidobacteraceae bacterium]
MTLAGLAGIYFAAAKLGLAFALVHPSASAIWPAAGIALAAFLLFGWGVWPAVFLGAFLANLTTHGSFTTSLCIGAGNTLEGLVGALLVNRYAHGRTFYIRPRDIVSFAGLAALLSTMVSPTVGLTSLVVAGFAPWADYGRIWVTWWLGDAAGVLVVAPVLVLWASVPQLPEDRSWRIEGAALLIALSIVSVIVFGAIPVAGSEHGPAEFLCVPFLFWAAFRLGRRAVATCLLVLTLIAIAGTLRGAGPFARGPPNESLLLLQAFLAVQAITMLAAAAVVWQLREAQESLRRQAVKDELTGLANYRALMSSLEAEIRRAQRAGAGRGFSTLVLDMDQLKQINDRYGHLVGNKALCRLARSLLASCRVTDTAARFGGDEFVIVLPETAEAGALQLAERITSHLAADAEMPRLSVSVGVAVYPRDGATAEKLLSAADKELYRSKGAARASVAPAPRREQV